MLHYENAMQNYLRIGLKLKEILSVLEFNRSQWLKSYVKFNAQEKNRSKKMATKMEVLKKLIGNVMYGKTIENLRNKIDVRLVSNRKLFKMNKKTKPYALKTFDSNLCMIRNRKVTLKLNKSANVEIFISGLS